MTSMSFASKVKNEREKKNVNEKLKIVHLFTPTNIIGKRSTQAAVGTESC